MAWAYESRPRPVHALNVRPHSAQLLHDSLVPAINVIHALNQRLATRYQPRQHQPRAGPQIRSLHDGSRECRWPPHCRCVSFDRNVRPHAHHFTRVQKAVLKDFLGNHRCAFRLRRQRHELRLHVRRKSGIVNSPPVMAPASRNVPASIRSGITVCSVPCSFSTPRIRSAEVPSPQISAPIFLSITTKSVTSGSRAAFSSTVSPSASAAAIKIFSVPVTVIFSNAIRAPFSRLP